MVTHISSDIIHFDAQNVIYFKIHSQMTINMNLIKYVQSLMPAVSQALWVLFWIWNILIYYTQLWIFSPLSTQTFDFWCLPEDLTRIIKLIYSHIRNWSLNWWIFKAIKAGIHWSTIPRAELNMLMISLNTITIQMIIMMKLKRILSWLTTSQQHQM